MSFVNVGNVLGQLGLVSSRLAAIAQQARDMQQLPPYRPGDNLEEPSSTRNVQDLSAVPPGYVRSPTGGLIPAPGGFSPVPTTALPVTPGIYIPPDYSESARRRREQRAGGWNERAAAQVIAQLRELLARLEAIFGGPTYIGQIIEQEIRNLEARVLSPDEALAFIRYVLSTMWAGLQQEALSPDAAIRNIAADLLRFAGGAPLPGGPGALTPGPRPAPTAGPVSPGESIVAGIGAAVGGALGAVRSEVAGLGATIRGQGDRISAGVQQQGAQTRSALTEQNRWFTEWRRNLAEWQSRVEGGYLRPLRENMFSPRELNAALERLIALRRV